MLIEKYDLEVFTPPCEPGAERFSAIAHLDADIREVLPYLNATLRGAIYDAQVPSLRWTKGGHYVTFQPKQIAVSNVEDREAALREVRALIDIVNRTWERRHEIEPNYEMRRRPSPLEVYKLLPRTNCKQCGEPTCFVFATKLAAGQVIPSDCPPLADPQFAQQKARLEELVPDLPALG
ncbi:MAG: (Fe-S)-binding protein [Anaerolineae bacterium]